MLLREEIEDDAIPGFLVLYLIFREQNSVFLLLGRQEAAAASSEEGSAGAPAEDKEGSVDLGGEEKDDDSPYFVKITLD